MLADGIAVTFRAAGTTDTPGSGIVDVDELHPAAETPDPLQGRRLVKDRPVYLQPGRNDQTNHTFHGSGQFLVADLRSILNGIAFFREGIDQVVMNFFGSDAFF